MKTLSIIGNVGIEPHSAANGQLIMSVAVDNGKKADGTKADPLWVNVIGVPKSVVPYIVKGNKVYVQGNTSIKIYQSNQGPILDISIYCSNLELIGGKPRTAEDATATATDNQQQVGGHDNDSNIPY